MSMMDTNHVANILTHHTPDGTPMRDSASTGHRSLTYQPLGILGQFWLNPLPGCAAPNDESANRRVASAFLHAKSDVVSSHNHRHRYREEGRFDFLCVCPCSRGNEGQCPNETHADPPRKRHVYLHRVPSVGHHPRESRPTPLIVTLRGLLPADCAEQHKLGSRRLRIRLGRRTRRRSNGLAVEAHRSGDFLLRHTRKE